MLRRNLLYSRVVHDRSIESRQRGLGALGTLIVLALAAAVGYYLYLSLGGEEETPTCSTQYESCMQACRRSQTDNSDMQACQKKCEDDQAFCEVAAKRNR
jgi:hypothetical protein